MKILIVWSGAVVPAYRPFFRELARDMRVRVLAPRRWKHGSREFLEGAAPETACGAAAASGSLAVGTSDSGEACEFVPAAYLPRPGSRYFVPALAWHLLTYRPRYLYLMDEMDRPSTVWHALLARLCLPSARVVCYCLQNLRAPSYYRRAHRWATRLNHRLVDRAIAASAEAEAVLQANGYAGPTCVVPLWAAEDRFHPADTATRAALRAGFGLQPGDIALVFAGSMAEAKGLDLLAEVLPRFPRLAVLSAGDGPLAAVLPARLGPRWRHLGPLSGADLLRLYQAGDYVILPSRDTPAWKEQIGRALIEGILCGCIAIGSDSGHIPGLTLFPEATFRQGDAESLAALLGRLPLPDADSVRQAQRRNVGRRFTASAAARATRDFLIGTPTGKAG